MTSASPKSRLKKLYATSPALHAALFPLVRFREDLLSGRFRSPRARVDADFLLSFRRPLPRSSPSTLNEKLNVLKSSATPLQTRCADKIAVRAYVDDTVGPDILVPLLGTWRTPRDLARDWPSLPSSFVLKVNHGSGQNFVVRDKASTPPTPLLLLLRDWLRCSHSRISCERPYRDIPPAILAESLLADPLPPDYKIHCFRGHALFVQVDTDRETRHRRNFYSPSWSPLDFTWSEVAPDGSPLWPPGPPVPRPEALPDMLRVARLLSRSFPYARIDLYAIGPRVRFGEITFFHGSGLEHFSPPSLDARLGRLLPLDAPAVPLSPPKS